VQQHFLVVLVHARQHTAELIQRVRILAGIAPLVPASVLWPRQIERRRRLRTVVEKLVHRNRHCSRQLFKRLDCGNGVAILDARDVAAQQSSALFDVALAKFLFLTQRE